MWNENISSNQPLSTKEKLKKVYDYENIKKKKLRLSKILLQKLDAQQKRLSYNSKLTKSELYDLIQKYMNNEVVDVDIDIRNSKNFEKIIDDLLKKTKQRLDEKVWQIQAQGIQSKENNQQNKIDCQVRDLNQKEEKDSIDISNMNPWTIIETYQVVKAEETKVIQKENEIKERKEIINALNDQVSAKKMEAYVLRQENNEFIRSQKLQQKKWKEAQEVLIAEERAKSEALRSLRNEQILHSMEKKKRDKSNLRKQELEELDVVKKDLKKAEEDRRERKRREKERWEEFKIENSRRIKEREELMKSEADLEVKQMAEYKAKLDLEDQKKQKALNDRIAKSLLLEKNIAESAEVKKANEDIVRLDMKIVRDLQAKEKIDMQRDKIKKEKKLIQMKLITEENKKIAEEKKRSQARAEKMERERNVIINEETKISMKADEEATRKKKINAQKNYNEALRGQMSSQRNAQKKKEIMTNTERSINQNAMEKILNNPSLQKKILEKLQPVRDSGLEANTSSE